MSFQLPIIAFCTSLAILSGCQRSGIKAYWDNYKFDFEDIRKEEDHFAAFATLAINSPREDSFKAIDRLFDKLVKDEVAYYVYTSWIDGAFYNVLSPCRDAALYSKAVDRIIADGVLTESECEQYLRKREWIGYNQAGAAATLPGVSVNGEPVLVIVLDQGCPSCRLALDSLAAKPEWTDIRKVAICCGYGPAPIADGWEYYRPQNASAVFDPKMTPVYFVVDTDGNVETGYKLVK